MPKSRRKEGLTSYDAGSRPFLILKPSFPKEKTVSPVLTGSLECFLKRYEIVIR